MIKRIDDTNIKEIHTLFTETVHNVNNKDYSILQLNKWAPLNGDLSKFSNRLLLNDTFVYIKNEIIIGYISINDNLIDHLYIHKDYQRQGVAKALIEYIYPLINYPVETYASITALPFFINQGFNILFKNKVKIDDVILINYKLRKIKENEK